MAIVASILVARMMRPEELGVFTVVMSVSVVLNTLQAAGASEILLYSAEVNHELKRRVLGLTLCTTAVVCGILVLGRPFWIKTFGTPGAADVADIIAIQTALAVFTVPVLAMWRREEAFDKISLVNIAGGATLSALQVLFVFAGYSFMGLAYAALAATFVTLVLTSTFGWTHLVWIPSFRGLGKIASYGGKLFGANALGVIYTQSTSAIIGALGGVSQSALFGRAYMTAQIYGQTIGRAIDPILNARLASHRRSGIDGNPTLFLFSRHLLTISTMFFGFIAICADLIVPLIFGQQWVPAVPAMQILTAGLVLTPLTSPTVAVLLAANRPGMLVQIRSINVLLRIAALVVLVPYGLTAVAWGMVATAYCNWAQSVRAAYKVAGLPVRQYLLVLFPSFMAGLVPVCLSLAARFGLSEIGIEAWALLVATGAIMTFLSLASLVLSKHPLWGEFATIRERITDRPSI